MENKLECQGSCKEHEGQVRSVLISGNSFPETEFNYCENAVKEDLRRGFSVSDSFAEQDKTNNP